MDKSFALVVLVQFFRVIEQTVEKTKFFGKFNVKAILLSSLMKEGMSMDDAKLVSEFYRKPLGKFNIASEPSEESLKEVIQYMYDLMCKEIGPVDIDKIFGKVLDVVESTKEGRAYSPKNFL